MEYCIITVCLGNVESATLLKINSSIGDELSPNLRTFKKKTRDLLRRNIQTITVKRQGSIPRIKAGLYKKLQK